MRVRLPRVRFRLWWLIVAVAAVALATWVIRMGSLSLEYHPRFTEMALKASQADVQADFFDQKGDARVAARYQRVARHYVALASKYQRASRHPWRLVAPDPPEPRLPPVAPDPPPPD